ncbi:hypothetical protein Bca52824_093738 [Brassica carinata]|uniref:UBL3-like ubiquitin domain-containing protein n=1 Tax=Brassica carinata TaxID=52824 RepID=A0A8X7P5N4_BRACI|nr:hypothetical protein Bca52824_093738 [Brassica carinata]
MTLLNATLLLSSLLSFLLVFSPTFTVSTVLFQSFKWESWTQEGGFYNSLHRSIDDLSNSGITHVWLPPSSQSAAPEAIRPKQLKTRFRGRVEVSNRCTESKGINEVKLISSGKILENNKTVAQCKTPFGEVAGGGVTLMLMHVVVQPCLSKAKTASSASSYIHKDDNKSLSF